MNCLDLAWESRGARPLSAEEAAHVAGCASCQADQALRRALHAGGGASEALSAQILARAHDELSRQPAAPSWTRAWLWGSLAAVACAAAGVLGFFHVRPGIGGLGPLRVTVDLLLFGAAFVLGGRAAFGPGLVPRGRIAALVLAVAAAGALLVGAAHGSSGGEGPWRCFGGIVEVSAVPLLLFFAVVRLRSRAWLSGACAGLAAGALGEAAFFLHCPLRTLRHLVGVHLSAWLVIAALGAVLVALFPARIWRPKRT